jgi:ATP-dependent Lhr-like helicase
VLREWGASFIDELLLQTGLPKPQLEAALGELVALGVVTSDQFHGLRALLSPRDPGTQRRRGKSQPALASGGRWSLLRSGLEIDQAQRIERVAQTLLTRYGVVFRKLLERETNLPAWRDLLYHYRRMEARGEIRGGRFVNGFSGEQFALPEAVAQLRETRRQRDRGQLIAIGSTDPLNLTGIVTPGKRLPAQAGYRILYRDGKPLAHNQNGEISIDASPLEADHGQIRNLLTRRYNPASFHAAPDTLV